MRLQPVFREVRALRGDVAAVRLAQGLALPSGSSLTRVLQDDVCADLSVTLSD